MSETTIVDVRAPRDQVREKHRAGSGAGFLTSVGEANARTFEVCEHAFPARRPDAEAASPLRAD